jgi:hypothetical protein
LVASTTFEIGRTPARWSRRWSQSGDGPTFTSAMYAAVNRRQRSGSGIETWIFSDDGMLPFGGAVWTRRSGAPVIAWISRATPSTDIVSGRFGVMYRSSTVSANSERTSAPLSASSSRM